MPGTRKLGRTSDSRRAMLRAMVTYLFEKGKIETTVTRAKEVRAVAEKMITLGKQDSLHAKRQIYSFITKEDVAKKLIDELGPKYADRNGGYTRIIKIGARRGDCLLYTSPGGLSRADGTPERLLRGPRQAGRRRRAGGGRGHHRPRPQSPGGVSVISVKTPGEIELMREAGRISARALQLGGEAVRPGVTTAHVNKVIHDYIVSQGATPNFLGLYGFPASACISVNDTVIHGIPSTCLLYTSRCV